MHLAQLDIGTKLVEIGPRSHHDSSHLPLLGTRSGGKRRVWPNGPVTWPAIFAQLLTRPDGAVAKTRTFRKVKRRALRHASYQGTM